jgi:hypothetical protein
LDQYRRTVVTVYDETPAFSPTRTRSAIVRIGFRNDGRTAPAFVIIRLDGGAGDSGAAGEMTKVAQAFQPSGRICEANSLYALKFRYPCTPPTGTMNPTCGPIPKNLKSIRNIAMALVAAC